MLYSHDTYGLGHLRRCVLIAERLATLTHPPSVVIATGSPRTHSFPLPRHTDVVKLPCVTKRPDGRYEPRDLRVSLQEVIRLRSDILRAVVRDFNPDLVLVDHAAAGMEGELVPLLHELGHVPTQRRPRLVLGLRDIIDDRRKVADEWRRLRAWELIEQVYDRILVYGDRRVLTTAEELGLPEMYGQKLRFVGYLGRSWRHRPKDRSRQPLILVTTGGGGDGHRVLKTYRAFLARLDSPARFRSVVVTGPFLSPRRQADVEESFASLPQPVELLRFTDQLPDLMRQASGVIAMAGYNTVTEILSAGVPALLMPREKPRREQRLRAERLAGIGGIEMLEGDNPDPRIIATFVDQVVQRRPLPTPHLRLDGLDHTVQEIEALLDREDHASRRGDDQRAAAPA